MEYIHFYERKMDQMMRVRKYPALLLVCLMISSLLTVSVSAAEMQPETEISAEETEALLTDAEETETAIQEETEDLIEIETELPENADQDAAAAETESIPETDLMPETETEIIPESETELHPVIEEPLEEETFLIPFLPKIRKTTCAVWEAAWKTAIQRTP